MNNLLLHYREESPSAGLSHFIQAFWEFKVSDELSAPLMHEIFPDGCLSILLARNNIHGFQQIFVAENNLKSINLPVNAGDLAWGMRILPEAGRAFFGTNPAEIKHQPFSPGAFPKRFSPELEQRLYSCENFADAIKAFEDYAGNFGVKREEIDRRLTRATGIFIESEGLAKISETAKKIGLSERQFERNYLKASGLKPKQFAGICRFRATAISMVKNSAQNWANRAAEKGFADQSHLNREFARLTGNSPVEFSENISRIEHGKILE